MSGVHIVPSPIGDPHRRPRVLVVDCDRGVQVYRDTTSHMDDRIRLGATLAAGVILPGLANAALSGVGYPLVGTAVWALGYLLAVLVVWHVWIRPLDVDGPEPTDDRDQAER